MSKFGLVPLLNFGEVAPNLYRSAQPYHLFQYNWLWNNLGVKRIVNLRSELQHDDKYAHKHVDWTATDLDFDVVDIMVDDHRPPTIEQAKQYVSDLQWDSSVRHADGRGRIVEPPSMGVNTPTLIHCAYGHGRTSTFSVLSKVALGMTIDEAIQDEADRFHYQFRHKAQEAWLRNNIEEIIGR